MLSTMPLAQTSVAFSPLRSMSAPISDSMYGCEPERVHTLPLLRGSASSS